ncbi:MAG: hypothetical protein JWP87_3379 [Labilithrix sp.]|nr:hypothetical protein [Labilithrix sp.]
MSDDSITEWFASIHRQSEATIALVLDAVRKNGEDVSDFVVIAADLTDEATRFFVNQLGDGPLAPNMPGFVGAIPKETVARVLRLMDAAAFAEETEKPVEEGSMRLLIAARGRLQCADIKALPPMSKGGSA